MRSATRTAGAAAILLGVVSAQRLDLVVPRGAAPVESVTLRCYGAGLADVTGVLWFRPGIEVHGIRSDKDDRCEIDVTFTADCPLGRHPMLLHTARGVTRLRTLHVGPLPTVFEEEGAHVTPDTAQLVPLERAIEGRLRGEECDWYAVEVEAGSRVVAEIECVRLGDVDLDLELEWIDSDGRRVARADDSALGRLDPLLVHTFESAGRYRIGVRDVAWRGDVRGFYRLYLGTFPRPVSADPPGGPAGQELAMRLVEADGLIREVAMQMPDDGGVAEVWPSIDDRRPPTPLFVRVSAAPVRFEGDSAEPATPTVAFQGVVATAGEQDRFPLRVTKGEDLDVVVLARRMRSPLDAVLDVFDAEGNLRASNDDSGGPDSSLRFKAEADGVITLGVRDQLGRGGPDWVYRIEARSRSGDSVSLRQGVPGRRPEDCALSVPRGGRVATLLVASDNADGRELGMSGLPTGVTATVDRFRGGVPTIPIVFEAAADAPLAATEVAPVWHEVEQRPVASFRHTLPLLRVENDRSYTEVTLHSIPLAVADRCPFRIEVQPPQLPIVLGGPLQLRFEVVRDEGFTADVAVEMLWKPPGVGAGGARVPGGDTSGELGLGADGNSTIGQWPIVLLATAAHDGVSRTVSSQVVTLDVSERWIDASVGKVRTEQGTRVTLPIALNRKREFDGEVVARLLRLPKGVEVVVPPVVAGADHIDVEVTIAAAAELGRHTGQYLELEVQTPQGGVVHRFGGGELWIDEPLPEHLRSPAKGEGGS